MLLIYPPFARSPEPPVGIARISAFLQSRGMPALCLDLCQEGYDYLLGLDFEPADTRSAVALKRRDRSLAFLKSPACRGKEDRYKQAVSNLNRCLRSLAAGRGLVISLSDYQDSNRSPLKRADLLAQADDYESHILYPLFAKRVKEAIDADAERMRASGLDPQAAPIGLSLCYLSQALSGFAILGFLRAVYPGRRVILGGGLVSSWIRQGILPADENFSGLVSAILPGPGEESLGPYLDSLGLSARASLQREGWHGEDSALTSAPCAPPDYSDFAQLEYLSPGRIIPYSFSSGCPWLRCRFCPEVAEGNRYSAVGTARALAEIRQLRDSYKPDLFHFSDSEIGPAYLRLLADSGLGTPWYGFSRFSSVLLDIDLCRRLADSGCVMLQLGLESADQGVLDSLNKGTSIGDIERILINLEAVGISAYIYLLFGTISEGPEEASRTRAFVETHASRIDFLNLAIFNLPVSSQDAKTVATRGFSDADLSLYHEFSHPLGWNRDRVRAFLAGEFFDSPRIRPLVQRTPPSFSSNHAPFFIPQAKKG